MTGDPRLIPNARVLEMVTYNEGGRAGIQRREGAASAHAGAAGGAPDSGVEQEQFRAGKAGDKNVPRIEGARGPHAVTSMADVALVSIEPANSALSGTKVMARALDALARANVELLAITSSSYRQSFCFLVRQTELERAIEFLEEGLSLELAHGYLKPFRRGRERGVDRGGGRGNARHAWPGGTDLHGDFPAQHQYHRDRAGVQRADHRDRGARTGLEQAVRAIHEECGLGK